MKKKLLLFLPIAALIITGCGDKKAEDKVDDETKTLICKMNVPNTEEGYTTTGEYKVEYKGKYVERVTSTEIVTSENETILNYFEEYLHNTYDEMDEKYGGYDTKITNENGEVKAVVKIDYTKYDIEKYVEDVPAVKSYIEDGKYTVEGIKKLYGILGAKCE